MFLISDCKRIIRKTTKQFNMIYMEFFFSSAIIILESKLGDVIMHRSRKAQKKEKKAMTVSLYGNLFFVIVELITAIITSSQAVLLDAVYDGVEFFMLLPSIFLIPLLYKPSSEKHPFGYMQIETLFVVVKGIMMTAVTIGLIANNLNLMLHGGHLIAFQSVAYFELFACILGIAVSLYLRKKNKAMNSPLLETERKGWEIDSIVSLGMTAAFLLPKFFANTQLSPIIPYIDQIITIFLSIFMLPMPIKTVITGIRDLMLIPPEQETIEDIKNTVEPIIGIYGHTQLYYDIVRTGRKLWISVYITFDKDTISLSRFKIIQARCIQALTEKYSDFYFELLPDIEFTGTEIEKLEV